MKRREDEDDGGAKCYVPARVADDNEHINYLTVSWMEGGTAVCGREKACIYDGCVMGDEDKTRAEPR